MNMLMCDIDIKESSLRKSGSLLDILLIDRTTKKNILWATDSYAIYGKRFLSQNRITPSLVTGNYGMIIQPRASKSLDEQRQRTKDRGEVFTSLKIVDQINRNVDAADQNYVPNKHNWKEYVQELKLEISCGEAPFIVTRYNPTAHAGKLIKLENRVGFLDKKLKVVSKYCDEKKEWLYWAKEAFKASYGYEWQGDNILIARENLLYTFIDYYTAQFERLPTVKMQEEIANIISWNIFQMDGLRYVVPMSCHHETKVIPGETTLFETIPDIVEKYECEGCKYNRPSRHNGIYVKVMDWNKNKIIKFLDLIK